MSSLYDYYRATLWNLTRPQRGWTHARIKDLCHIAQGPFNSSDCDDQGPYSFYRATATNPQGAHSTYSHEGEFLVFIKDGGSPWNLDGEHVGMGEVFYVNGRAALTNGCLAIQKKNCLGPSLRWIAANIKAQKALLNAKANFTSGVGHIGQDNLLNLSVACPPKEQEDDILRQFESAKKHYEQAVTTVHTLIASSASYFQSLVWHAVTGKYEVVGNELRKRPAGELKESGVPWIGKIGREWNVLRVKDVSRIVNGGTPDTDVEDYWGGDFPWYTPVELENGGFADLNASPSTLTDKGVRSKSLSLLPKGSIIVGARASVGNLGRVENPGYFNQSCIGILPIAPRFGIWELLAVKPRMLAMANGTTFSAISGTELGGVLCPIPPDSEAANLHAFLEHKRKEQHAAEQTYYNVV